MIPYLYKETETDFEHNGMGPLTDATITEVTEVLNGEYELYLEYPAKGFISDALMEFRYILAKPNDKDDPHAFRIYEIDKETDPMVIRVYASTKSDELANDLITEFKKSGTPESIMKSAKGYFQIGTSYEFKSDIKTEKEVDWFNSNPLQCLSGQRGSLLDVFGGEFKKTNDVIHLNKRRGKDNVITARLNKQIDGFKYTISTKGLVTRIIPYYTFYPETEDQSGNIIREDREAVFGDIVISDKDKDYPASIIRPIDFTQDEDILVEEVTLDGDKETVEMVPNLEKMNEKAKEYFKTINPGVDVPKIQIEINLLQLYDSSQYSKFKNLELLELGDTLTVYIKEFDIDSLVKIHSLTYDSLSEKTLTISAGSKSTSTYESIQGDYNDALDDIQDYIDDGDDNAVIESANGSNKNWYGKDKPTKGMREGDLWYKDLGNNEYELYRYVDGQWVLIAGAGINEQIEQAIKDAEDRIQAAEEEAIRMDRKANSILEGLGIPGIVDSDLAITQSVKDTVNNILEEIDGDITGVSTKVDNELGIIEQSIVDVKQSPEHHIVGYNTLTSTAEGNKSTIARIKNSPGSEILGYNTVEESADRFVRTLGSSDTGVRNQISRIVQSSGIIQTEVSNQTSGFSTRIYQMENSYAMQIKNAGDVVTAIDANPKGVRIKGKNITLDGDVDAVNFTVTNNMIANNISASKITFGTIDGSEVNVINLNARNISTGRLTGVEVNAQKGNIGLWNVRDGIIYSPLNNNSGGYTTLKATGNVALGTASPEPGYTGDAGLQIWHNGNLRWNGGEGLIWPGNTNGIVISSLNWIHLRPSATVEVDGRVVPRSGTSTLKTLGAESESLRWYRSYVKVGESISSDSRLKQDVKALPKELVDRFTELRPKLYEIHGKKHFGYMAQDVERILYKYSVNKVGHEKARDYMYEFDMLNKSESYMALVYSEIATVKSEELQVRIEKLEREMEDILNG